MKRITSIIAFLLMAIQMVTAQVAGHDYARVIGHDSAVSVDEDEFYRIARSVTFPVNKYDIPKNSDFYRELTEDIIPEMNAGNYRLEQIIMRGAASPEGPTKRNEFLANARRKALLDLINKNMLAPSCEDCIVSSDVAEDYAYLVKLMKDANDKDFSRVHDVVEQNANDAAALKLALQRMDGGKLWTRLLKEYFPQLRSARVVLIFTKNNLHVDATAPVLTIPELDLGVDSCLVNEKLNFKLNVLGTASSLNIKVEPKPEPKEEPKVKEPKVKEPKVKEPKVKPEKPVVIKGQKYPLISVKTNLLYDFLYSPPTGFQPSPTIEAEYYFRNGWLSILAEYEFPWWSNEEKREFFQIQNWQLEPRYYFKHDHYFNGLYVGAYGMFNRYDFALPGNDGSGVQGEGAGIGASVGYVMPIGKKTSRWKIEFNAKVGYYETHYDPYDYEYNHETGVGKYYYRWFDGPSTFHRRNWRYRWLGPTGVGIKISYDLFRRKIK